ncbi:MAG TPA: CPBP family glutamic-type intramembrane protease [Anaerolineales bacterium]|nr:CPBP family glutamic-type intramembrane protease [Anaerolineales bacterium]
MNIQNESKRRTIRNLAIFIFFILASGWLGRGLDGLMGNPSAESLGMLLWIITPLAVTLLLRTFAGDGWKDFGIRPNFKGNWVWYGVALLVYPVLTALVLIIGGSLGFITFPGLSADTLGLLLQAFALGLLPQFIKNIFEEAPWRGYLAPKVYSLGLNDFIGHAIVGLVWGAWHIPYYLFFLDRAILSNFTTLDLAVYIPLAIGVMISWAFVYGEIRLLTNSFWPAVLMHMVEDAFLIQLFTGNHIQIRPGTDWLVSPMNGLLMACLFIALAVGLRQFRKRKMSVAAQGNLRVVSEAV